MGDNFYKWPTSQTKTKYYIGGCVWEGLLVVSVRDLNQRRKLKQNRKYVYGEEYLEMQMETYTYIFDKKGRKSIHLV